MRIGIDLDEVLAGFFPALIKYHNVTYGTSLTIEQFHSYNIWEAWGGTKEEVIQKIYDFYKTPYFRDIKPIDYSREAVNILKKDNDLIIITARQEDIVKETKDWINKYFPDVFSNIFFTSNYLQNKNTKTKKYICDLMKVDILIEDCLEYAIQCSSKERKVLLFDYPWNKSPKLPNRIYRIHSWKDAINSINI